MICPKCYAEYLENIKDCGDCNILLVDACLLDLPIPEMTWSTLATFNGKIYADMATEILDTNDVPYYLKMDWASSALNIEGTGITGQIIRIFVPNTHFKKASDLIYHIVGDKV